LYKVGIWIDDIEELGGGKGEELEGVEGDQALF
jgi:hypothetical protein